MKITKEIREILKSNSLSMLNYYLGTIIEIFIQSSMPIVEACLIDEVIYNKNLDVFVVLSFVYVMLYVGYSINFILVLGVQQYVDNTMVVQIKKRLLNKILYSYASELLLNKTGDNVEIITKDANETFLIIRKNIMRFLNEFILFFISGTLILFMNWKIGLLALFIAPLSILISHGVGEKIRKLSTEQRERYGFYISWLFEVLNGLNEIRLLGAIKNVGRLFNEKNKELIGVDNKINERKWFLRGIVGLTQLFLELSMYILAIYLIIKNEISIGLFVAIISYYNSCKLSINNIIEYILELKQRRVSIDKVVEKFNLPSEHNTKRECVIIENEICFNNVDFYYKSPNMVLKNFNLVIKNNELISIVGRSGAGKSTLLYLLLNFYEPTKGSITISGEDVRNIPLQDLRKKICVVHSNSMFFPGSIRYNICLGAYDATDEELYNVCKKVKIYDDIQCLPDKLDTVIGEDGIELSKGQKQRIVLARILLMDPSIIVLDEATSAIDENAESEIIQTLIEFAKGKKTMIFISHRLSTIMHSDRIAVLVNGHIDSIGTHSQLIKESDEYKRLFITQVKGDLKYAEEENLIVE